MPTINCIEYVNVGYPSSFCEDIKLRAGSVQSKNGILGGHVYVLADNGVGKSSLIALVLYVIRPYMTDFLKGDEGSFRHISQYITNEGTNLILIEWILDNRSQDKMQNFLLTGYAASSETATKRDGDKKEIKELFFSCRYTTDPEKDDVTFENIPFKDANNDATLSEIKNFFNKKKKDRPMQEIYCDNVKEDWIENLAQYNIESELFLIQSKMNQKEGAQQTILNFSTPKDFLNKMLYYSIPFEDFEEQKQLMRGLEENFDKLKRGAFYSAQIEYYSTLLTKLNDHKPLSENYANNLGKIHHVFQQSTQFENQGQTLLQYIGQIKIKTAEKIQELNENCNRITKENLRLERELLIDEIHETLKNIGDKNKKINLNRGTLATIDHDIQLYTEFPLYIKSKHLDREISTLNRLISDKNKPLQQDYQEKTILLAVKLKDNLLSIQNQNKGITADIAILEKQFGEINQQLGETNSKIKMNILEITANRVKIKKITSIQLELENKGILEQNVSPRVILTNFEASIKKLVEEGDGLSNKISGLNETLVSLNRELTEHQLKYKSTKQMQLNAMGEITNIISEWSTLTRLPFFKEKIDSSPEVAEDVQYHLIDDSMCNSWNNEREDFLNKINLAKFELESAKKILSFFKENGHFPPDSEVTRLFELIKAQKNSIHYGWDYVKNNYGNQTDLIKRLYRTYPHYLEGLISGEDLSKLDDLIKEFESENQVSSPIFLIHTDLLSQIIKSPNDPINSKFYRIITAGLEKKVVPEEMQEYAEKLEKQIRDKEDSLDVHQKLVSKYDSFLDKVRVFKIKNSAQVLLQKRQVVDQSAQDLLQIQSSIQKVTEEIASNKEIMGSIQQQLKDLKNKQGVVQSNYNQLNRNLSELENRYQILEEIKNREEENNSLAIDLERFEIDQTRVKEEKERLGQLFLKQSLINQELQNLNSLIEPELKHDAENMEESRRSDIISRNFEILKAEFLDARSRFRENAEIKDLQERKERYLNDLTDLQVKITLDAADLEKITPECRNYNNDDFNRIIMEKNHLRDSLNTENGGLEADLKVLDKQKKDQRRTWRDKYGETYDESQIDVESFQLESIQTSIISLKNSLQKNLDTITLHKKEVDEKQENLNLLVLEGDKCTRACTLAGEIAQELAPKCENPQDILANTTPDHIEFTDQNWYASLEDINGKIMALENDKRQVLAENTQIIEKINSFCRDIVTFTANSKFSQIRIEVHIESFISFGFKNFLAIPSIIVEVTRRQEQLTQLVREIEDDFKSIKTAINSRVFSLYTALQHIQNTNLPVSPSSNLKGSKVFEIKWIKPIDMAGLVDNIRSRIDEYISTLLKEDKFPARIIGYVDFIRDVFVYCFASNIKDITFLIPRPNNAVPVLKPFLEMQNSSGGEKTNLAILLFCLLANYRLSQISNKNRNIFRGNVLSMALFMDNPIGRASRDDFIELQTKLAEELRIQLIVFSAIRNPEILVHFNTVVPVFSYSEDSKGEKVHRDILKEDASDNMFKLASSAISRTKALTLDSMFDNNER